MADVGGRARLPGVSGRWSAIVLLVLFVAVAIILPLALHRSAWLEAEIVVAAWFVIWTAVLTWLGYSGRTVDEDWTGIRRPRSLFGRAGIRGGHGLPTDALPYVDVSGLDAPDIGGGGDDGGLGALGAIVLVVAAGAVIAVVVVAIGFVIPLVALALYTIIRTMLNRVAARGHVTRGDLPRSMGRGVIWAALYTAPLALAIWLLHVAF